MPYGPQQVMMSHNQRIWKDFFFSPEMGLAIMERSKT